MRLPFRATAIASSAVLFFAATSAFAEPTKVTFVHTNDLDRMEASDGKGGFPALMSIVKAERAAGDHVIFTHGGDAISPSLLSGFDMGVHIVDLLNSAGVDIMVLGNHEFDFGPKVAMERMAEANFPILATNAIDKDGEIIDGAVASWTTRAGDYTIGFFGLVTPDTTEISSPDGVTFRSLDETAREMSAKLREDGADLVVALAHTGIREDLDLVNGGSGIDILLTGHDHLLMSYYNGKVAMMESGSQADYVSVLEVTMDTVESRGKKRFVWAPSFRTVPTVGVAGDPEMSAKVESYLNKLSTALDVEIGTTTTQLDSRRASVRATETAIGNLFSDAIRKGVNADVAITNGGGIRGDKIYDAGTVLTRRDIQTELPFGNTTVKLEVSGAQLVAALENGFSQVEETAGRFPSVSGMTVTWDAKAPPGGRVKAVMVGDSPVDINKTYTLAANDYIAGGGDGYSVLKSAKNLIDPAAAQLMALMVVDYVSAAGKISPQVENRLILVK
jgi:2',3'-cyclic-nucleotide 2'-phosphodiesterase (5'-nucleotidase family)